MESLEDILKECNRLRMNGRIVGLHRTLHEFNGFVTECIFGPKQGWKKTPHELHFPNKKNPKITSEETALLEYAVAFREWCRKEYGKVE